MVFSPDASLRITCAPGSHGRASRVGLVAALGSPLSLKTNPERVVPFRVLDGTHRSSRASSRRMALGLCLRLALAGNALPAQRKGRRLTGQPISATSSCREMCTEFKTGNKILFVWHGPEIVRE